MLTAWVPNKTIPAAIESARDKLVITLPFCLDPSRRESTKQGIEAPHAPQNCRENGIPVAYKSLRGQQILDAVWLLVRPQFLRISPCNLRRVPQGAPHAL